MNANPVSVAQSAAALDAFLRGIERRGLVLAEAQCGDPTRARIALAATAWSFRAHAGGLPLSGWPPLYWHLLLAQPTLRSATVAGKHDPLSQLSAGPRAALLLRLVAGLDQAQGAEVLHVSPEAYRHALYRALQSLQERGVDEASLLSLRDRLQAQANATSIKPAARPDAAIRSAATWHTDPPRAQTHAATPRSHAATEEEPRAPRWFRWMLIALAGVLLSYLGSTFWKPGFLRLTPAAAGRFEPLREQAPAETMPPTAAALAGADFELLNDPDGERIARDLDLYAWYAAGADAATANPGTPTALPESSAPETTPEVDADPTEGGNAQ